MTSTASKQLDDTQLDALVDELTYVKQAHEHDDCDKDECSEYLGSFMSLDPCGRYHHMLSPNSATSECVAYWDMLDEAAGKAGGYITGGEGDPTDIYFTWQQVGEQEEEQEEEAQA